MPNPRLCRRIKANLIWLAKDLELGLSPLELETLRHLLRDSCDVVGAVGCMTKPTIPELNTARRNVVLPQTAAYSDSTSPSCWRSRRPRSTGCGTVTSRRALSVSSTAMAADTLTATLIGAHGLVRAAFAND